MSEHGILFSGPMVRALLDGRKTQTRRLAKPEGGTRWWQQKFPSGEHHWLTDVAHKYGTASVLQARHAVGDRLWVRERFRGAAGYDGIKPKHWGNKPIWYDADGEPDPQLWFHLSERSHPSIHLPRWASRIILTVTDVRVQRLNDCTDADALAEGVIEHPTCGFHVPGVEHPNKDFPILSRSTPREMYAALWDTIHGSGKWLGNPWVVATTFTVERVR